MSREEVLRAAKKAAELEYPAPDDEEESVTGRTVRMVLQEGFVRGYMRRYYAEEGS